MEKNPTSRMGPAGGGGRAGGGRPAPPHDSVEAIVGALAADRRAGDVVLVMSNGAFGNIWEKLLAALRGA